jgi:hypothetical protein
MSNDNNKIINLAGAKVINQPEPAKQFQDLPATPKSASDALNLLAEYQRLQTDAPKLATPGNPNPEKNADQLGGVLATFLFNNARPLLESFLICQTEYFPLVHGVGSALARGPLGPRIAQAVVAGFIEVDNAKREAVNEQQQKQTDAANEPAKE